MNMRKKPMNNYGGQKRRYGGGDGHRSGGGHHHGGNHNRPRKNYSAAREKYLAQARDAMASGDRVLSEYYLQHADHCWRMMMEENQNRPPRPQQPVAEQQPAENGMAAVADDDASGNSNQLPAFLTGSPYGQQQASPVDPATIQNWEERDA